MLKNKKKILSPFSRRLIIEEILDIIKDKENNYTPDQLTTRLAVRSPFLSKNKAEDYIYLLLEDKQLSLDKDGLVCLFK